MKKVLVLGKGKSGIAASNLLAQKGYKPTCTDDQDKIYNKEELSSFSFCVTSPGFSPESSWILACQQAGLKIVSELDLGLAFCKSKNIVAVTGTNGKTTIVTLISKMLEAQNKTYLLGNIGTPLCDKVQNIKETDYVVLEVSSFMLHQSNLLHPKIAIISNITPDHVEWHKTEENYINSKLKILNNQMKNDYCIFSKSDPMLCEYKKHAKANIFFVSQNAETKGVYASGNNIIFCSNNIHEVVAKVQDIALLGNHNITNVLMAVATAKLMGITNQNIANVLQNFKGLPHRITHVATINQIVFVDDSKSTNIDSTIKAVETFSGKNIVLLLGGYDKGLNVCDMLNWLSTKVRKLILFGPAGKRFSEVAKTQKIQTQYAKNLSGAFNLATKIAEKGDIVLLSPACSSFDEFSSYVARGEKFEQLVKEFEKITKTNIAAKKEI